MRLVDLNPRWFCLESSGPRVGLTFDCPCCGKIRLGVSFHRLGQERMDDDYIHAHNPKTGNIWTFSGKGFHDLTLYPSVDCSKSEHWHGYIQNGNIV